MRLVIYIFIFSQLFNLVNVLAENIEKGPLKKLIKWERVKEKKSNKLKKIIWKSYVEETFSENNNKNHMENNKSHKNFFNKKREKTKFVNQQNNKQELLEIQPHIPLNDFLNSGDYILSSNWVSAFSGGAGGGLDIKTMALSFTMALAITHYFQCIFLRLMILFII